MANALESLRILAGGPGRRVLPQEDYSFAGGAVPTQGELMSPYEREQAIRAQRADEADRARIGDTEALNAEMQQYGRPDVTARRNEEHARAMALKGESARVAGEANVRATKEAGNLREMMNAFGLEKKAENAQALQAQKDAAMGQRQAATGAGTERRQELQGLRSGKAHAPRAGGLMDMFFGPSQSNLDNARIAALTAENEGGNAINGGTVTMIAPDGGLLNVPVDRVAELEARGARRQ